MASLTKSPEQLVSGRVAYAKEGQDDRAIADYDEAIRLDPNFTCAIDRRAEAVAGKNELGGGTSAETLIASGAAYEAKGQYDCAFADFDEAIRLDPKNALFFYMRGSAHAREHQFDRATADFDEAIRFNSKNPAVFFVRSDAYAMTGQFDRAIADYDEAIRLYPNFTQAINRRVETIARKNELGGKIA